MSTSPVLQFKLEVKRLRRAAVAIAIWQPRPRSLAEARHAVSQLNALRSRKIKDTDVATMSDDELREAIVVLMTSNFIECRNAVAHNAYRPTQAIAEKCYERIPRINKFIMRVFGAAQGQLVMPPRAG